MSEEKEIQLFDDNTNEVLMPTGNNGVNAIGQVDISESLNQKTISNRLVRHVKEGLSLPNIMIDIRGLGGVGVSKYALESLKAMERDKGEVAVYIATDETIEKIMRTSVDMKEVMVFSMKNLIDAKVNVYEDVVLGEKLKKIGGNSIRSMRLNI